MNKFILGLQIGGFIVGFLVYLLTHSSELVMLGFSIHIFGDFLFLKKEGI